MRVLSMARLLIMQLKYERFKMEVCTPQSKIWGSSRRGRKSAGGCWRGCCMRTSLDNSSPLVLARGVRTGTARPDHSAPRTLGFAARW
jgi:hypothetical protein